MLDWIIHGASVALPLSVMTYWVWIRGGWFTTVFKQGRHANRLTLTIYPTVASWLRLSAPVVVPVDKISKVIFSCRCILLYAGPIKVAEVWLTERQVSYYENVLAEYCRYAEFEFSAFYPIKAMDIAVERYLGLHIASIDNGAFYSVIGEEKSTALSSARQRLLSARGIPHVQKVQ